MKVLFLSKSHPVYGGVERWLFDLVLCLERRGVECIVALAKGSRFHDSGRYARVYDGMSVVELDGSSGSAPDRCLAVERALRAEKPDVVVPVMLADGLVVATKLKARLGHRIVYPVHEIQAGIARDLACCGAWLDRIVFVDVSGQVHFGKDPRTPTGRQVVISCGVPAYGGEMINRFCEMGPLRIGWCGRLEVPQKRVTDLIALSRLLDDAGVHYELSVVGEGQAKGLLERGLRDGIESGRVRLVGTQSRDELYRSFYPWMDVLLVTSQGETGPLVAFEAMMCGCLVLSSDFHGRAENGALVDFQTCRLYPVGDMASAAKVLEEIAREPFAARDVARRGTICARQSRSLESMADRWHRLLQDVLADEVVATGGAVRIADKGDSRLRRWGVPDVVAERLRRILGRRFEHASAGEEWPRYLAK